MTVGLVVDGVSEYRSIGFVCDKVRPHCPQPFLRPVMASVDPMAPAPAIARALKDRIQDLDARGASLIVILLDRESRPECPGDLAQAIEHSIGTYTDARICVVLKDRMYENWLVSDIGALQRQTSRFRIPASRRGQVAPNKADTVDALAILKSASIVKSYDKVLDSQRIMRIADPSAIARNSRSFRRFLRCVSHTSYVTQSILPA